MKKFRFQLETLLKVTRMKKEEAEVAFAKAVRALEEERAYQRQLLEEMAQGQRDYEEISKEGTHIKIGRLMSFNQFFGWKRQQIEDQQQVILRANAVRQKAGLPPMPPDYSAGPGGYGGGTGAGGNIITR